MKNINIGILTGLMPLFVGYLGFIYLCLCVLYTDYKINKRRK